MTADPVRLLDSPDLDDASRDLLRVGAHHAPVAYDIEAGLSRFSVRVAELSTRRTFWPRSGLGAATTKLGAVLVVGAVLGSGWWLTPRLATRTPVAGPRSPVIAPGVLEAPPPALPAPTVTALAIDDHAPTVTPGQQPAVAVRTRQPSARGARRVLERGEARGASAPLATPPLVETDARAEIRLLARAKSLLVSEPSAALALLDQLREQHRAGFFVEEREALRISALATLGRTREARAQADVFLMRFPNGPHADRVRAIIHTSE